MIEIQLLMMKEKEGQIINHVIISLLRVKHFVLLNDSSPVIRVVNLGSNTIKKELTSLHDNVKLLALQNDSLPHKK